LRASNSRIKQDYKENRALRTETTINNTYDFGVGKRPHNLPKLRQIGFAANRRLIEIERLSHDCILGEDTFQRHKRSPESGLGVRRGCYSSIALTMLATTSTAATQKTSCLQRSTPPQDFSTARALRKLALLRAEPRVGR
jgi:hypothetical protein